MILLPATRTQANIPLPVQPFDSNLTTGGVLSSAPGDPAELKSNVLAPVGTHLKLPALFSAGFPTIAVKGVTDGTVTVMVMSEVDVLCDEK
jgi:hypothetical protein